MDLHTIFATLILCAFSMQEAILAVTQFSDIYTPWYGLNHLSVNPQGTEVQLLLDQSSGTGFKSKVAYGSGLFHIKMKLPKKKTGGIIPNFYLTSDPDNSPANHYELDFEFMGTGGILQTNVFNNDQGHREERLNLWFDPSEDFHTYEILWNSHHILFLVDHIPIREFKNNRAKGMDYPAVPMHIEATLWAGDWAGTVDWSQAPFITSYKDFWFGGCVATHGHVVGCDSEKFFWNKKNYLGLNPTQEKQMNHYRSLYMFFDYCSNPSTRKPECAF